jgi:hypothetical protein
MNKFTIKNDPNGLTISSRNIPMGQYFTGLILNYKSIFVKAYGEIVDLQDPALTWDHRGSDAVDVVDYEPLEIEVIAKKLCYC